MIGCCRQVSHIVPSCLIPVEGKEKIKKPKNFAASLQTSVAHHNLKPYSRNLTIKKGCCLYPISLNHWGEKTVDFALYLQLAVCPWNILSSLSLKSWQGYVCFLPSTRRRGKKREIFWLQVKGSEMGLSKHTGKSTILSLEYSYPHMLYHKGHCAQLCVAA